MAVIKDVAKLADVSVGTVSKYLNTPQNLKDETRRKVEEAINTLQYTPSPLARSMRTGKTNTIAIVAPDITNPFFAEIYDAIRVSSVNKGYTPILYTTDDDLETFKAYLTDISLRQIDGLILCFADEDEEIESLIEKIQSKIPTVLLSWDINTTKFNSVSIDVFEGILRATNHLISLGHKNIAYVGGLEKIRISREKFNGYVKALTNSGLEINQEFIFRGDFKLKTGYNAARKFAMNSCMPTAIVAENDILAIGSIKYFLQNKIRVPQDVAVVGFDNINFSSIYEPSLSTISLPIHQMGEEAIKLLVSIINKPDSKKKLIILRNELIIRNSTDSNAPVEFDL
jgi:LacI family transcriptional regulator, repressor for deo operon, udp, cdd, tsx, nupC, and nupG